MADEGVGLADITVVTGEEGSDDEKETTRDGTHVFEKLNKVSFSRYFH
ncbi:MAG: hypothetical protein WB421_20040 [Terriglobales bacterium]